jgi:hypothetical protein
MPLFRVRSLLLALGLLAGACSVQAQLYSPQESPWVMLRDYINKNKSDKPEGASAKPSKAASPAPATSGKKPASPAGKSPSAVVEEVLDAESDNTDDEDGVHLGTPVDAQGKRGIWSLVFESEDTTAWINDRDVVPQNGAVMVSVLFDHDPAMMMANGAVFRSAKARVRVDCSAQPATMMGITLFSKKGGDGRVVGEQMRPLALQSAPHGAAVEARIREWTKPHCR